MLLQFSLYPSMWFTCVALKSISKRLAQADNTLKSAENGNPIEELCIILAAVLELEIHMFFDSNQMEMQINMGTCKLSN